MPAGLDPATLERRIRALEAFGIHRTGWPGDDRAGAWLRDELAAVGVKANLERFEFPRVEYRNARVTWPDGHADGIPMYDGGFTDFGGIEGDLCEDGDPDLFGKIVIANGALRGDRRWIAPDVRLFYDGLYEQGVIGVVVPSGDPDGQVTPRDATHIRTPYDLPVLQVAARDARALASALLLGTVEARLEVDGERLRSRASNVLAVVPGADPEAEPVVVFAQKSGWFTAAGERGAGIAIWLALAEAIAAEAPPRPVRFVAGSGAELRNMGLESHLRLHPGLAKQTVCWLDLGPSLGARDATIGVTAGDPALADLASQALTAHGCVAMPAPTEPQTSKTLGQFGARYVTLAGAHPYSHSPHDTTDRAVDLDGTAAWGNAALTILRGLLAGD